MIKTLKHLGIGAVVLSLVFSVINGLRPETDAERERREAAEAVRPFEQVLSDARWECREQVLRRLVSPSTADFSGESRGFLRTAEGVDSSRVIVHGSVDSQNRMGAMLRARFECIFGVSEEPALSSVESVTVF